MDKAQTVKFINSLFRDVWTDLNESKIAEYYHKDVVAQFGQQVAQYKDIVHRLNYVKANFTKIVNQIEDIIVDGDKVSVRINQKYQKHEGGDSKDYAIVAIYYITNGKVSKFWGCIDPNVNYFEG